MKYFMLDFSISGECGIARGYSSLKIFYVVCTTHHRYPIFSTRYSVMCKVYTGYCGTSAIEHSLCACTVDNPLAKARGLSLRTGAQTMLYLSLNLLLNIKESTLIVNGYSVRGSTFAIVILRNLPHWHREWSGGANVLGKFPVPERPTYLDYSRARAYCACNRCGWGLLGHFFSQLSLLFSFSLSLGDGPI